MTHHHKLPCSSHFNRMTSIFPAYNHSTFTTAGHTDIAQTTKMEIHIQFHGAKSTQNGLSPAMENHMEECCDRLDKMIHRVQNRLGCQALFVDSVSSLLRPFHTPKEYWSGVLHSKCELSNSDFLFTIFWFWSWVRKRSIWSCMLYTVDKTSNIGPHFYLLFLKMIKFKFLKTRFLIPTSHTWKHTRLPNCPCWDIVCTFIWMENLPQIHAVPHS